jgi:Calx-beta domain/Carboxypeptidase regulatory-like domain
MSNYPKIPSNPTIFRYSYLNTPISIFTLLILFAALFGVFASAQNSETTNSATKTVSGRNNVTRIDDNSIPPEVKYDSPGILETAYNAVFGESKTPLSFATVNVNSIAADSAVPTASDNDYTRINNAILAAVPGDTIMLNGTFNWAEPNAAASWALGSDGLTGSPSTSNDDYAILAPLNLNNVTVTASSLGTAKILGPGDLAAFNLEGVFQFYAGGTNSDWTISNLHFEGFDNPIGFYYSGGPATVYSGTKILNNYILLPIDLNATVAPADANQNIGIHFAHGANQEISGNTIEIPGNGLSDTPSSSSASVGMQSNTSGGAVYDGLQITNNTVNILNAQSADAEFIRGIWENAHGHSSNVIVSGNKFVNLAGGNNPLTNRQIGFRVTSHSSATTIVEYLNNSVEGANIGFQWLSTGATTNPVKLTSNKILNNATGVILNTNGQAEFKYNRIVGNSMVAVDNNTSPGILVTANDNWWGCNYGPGTGGAGCVGTPNGNSGVITATTWLVLKTSASPAFTTFGGTPSTVTADLTFNSASVSAGGNVPDTTPATFATTTPLLGGMSPTSATLTSGLANSTFTALNSAGIATVSVKVDGQTINASVDVNPVVTSIKRKTPLTQITSASTVVFEVIFNAPVKNVDDTDFAVTTVAGAITGSTVTTVSSSSPFTTYQVTVMGYSGNGEIRLDLVDDDSIQTRVTNLPLGGSGTGNGNFNTGETYIVDTMAPTVVSIDRASTNPTNLPSVQFTVTFSENVQGVDVGDFALASTGTAIGTIATVASVSSSIYTVTLNSVTGDGTLGLNLVDNDSITDFVLPTAFPLGGPGAGNGNFTGQIYTVDMMVPTVTVEQAIAPQTDPTSTSPINFTVKFSEVVTGFTAADVVFSGAGATTAVVSGSGPVYNAAISGMNASGVVTASVAANAANDLSGNPSSASTSTDNSVTFNLVNTNVVVTSAAASGWGFLAEGTSGSIGKYFEGPPSPPLGIGSARLIVSSVTQSELIGKLAYNGTRFDQLTTLSYSTYGNAAPALPALQFNLDEDLTDAVVGFQGRLVYEPAYDVSQPVLPGTWQNWNALSPTAKFWATPNATSTIDTACPQSAPCTVAQIKSLYPNLGIHANPALGAILFKIGAGPASFDGNVDNFVLGINSANTTFDFEPILPTVTVEQASGQTDPTNASPINFTVTFNQPVTGFTNSDVTLGGTALPTTAVVTGSGAVYNVAVSGMSLNGTVTASVPQGAAVGAEGTNTASTSVDNSVLYDMGMPLVTINQAIGQTDPTSVSPVNYTAVFSEPVTGFATGDVTLSGTAFGSGSLPLAVVTQIAPNDGTTFNVAVSGMNSTGTVIASIGAGVAIDASTNGNAASTSTDNTVTFNITNTNVLVSSAAPLGWGFATETANGTGTFVTGPLTPPSGTGSARLTVDSTGGEIIAKNAFSGTRFDQITQLTYSTYQNSANTSAAIALQFDVDSDLTDGLTGFQGRLVYEPANDPSNTVSQGSWQNWNALAPTAKYWGSGSGPSRPFSNACPISAPCTRAQILTLFPNLGIRTGSGTQGVILFKIGGGVGSAFDGNVDKFTIGINSSNTTFDFEDKPPTVSIDDVTVTEGNGGTTAATFTVALSEVSTLPVTVQVSTANNTATTADNDYVAVVNQTVTIPAGLLSNTVSVNVNGDTTDEPNEAFFVNLSGATNAAILNGQGIGSITDDDAAPVVSIVKDAPASLTEGNAGTQSSTFTVSLSNASASPITVSVTQGGTATNPSEASLDVSSLAFPANSTASQTVTATINSDTIDEPDETFTATIAVTSGTATIGTATDTGTILDDDNAPVISIVKDAPTSLTELNSGTQTSTFTVSISNASASPISVSVTAGGTASTPSDFSLDVASLTFPANSTTSQTVTATINGDTIDEPDETFTATIAVTSGTAIIGTATATGTILDDDNAPVISIVKDSPASLTEGDSGTQTSTFTVSLSNQSSSTITVDIAAGGTANSPSDFTLDVILLSFAPLETTKTVTATIVGDTLVEPNETFTATLSMPTNATIGTATASGTINNDDAFGTLAFSSATYGVTEGTPTATITVTRTLGSAQAVSVNYATSNGSATGGDYTTSSGTLNWADTDSASKTFTVPITNDIISEVPETVNLTLSGVAGGATLGLSAAVLTITDNDGGGLVFISGNIKQYNFPAANTNLGGVTVTLSGSASGTTATDGSGNYTFSGLTAGGNFLVTPTMAGKVFEPINRSYGTLFSSVSNANFVAYNSGSVPRNLTVSTSHTVPGSPVAVPLILTSLGNETDLSFSLNYDASLMSITSDSQVACGSGATGCTLTVNRSTPGQLGVVLEHPTSFTAGNTEAVVVTFNTTVNPPNTASNTPVTFGNTPALREVNDVDTNPLPSNYTDALVIFEQNLEADVAGRFTGNGVVSPTDVTQIRLFSVGSATPNLSFNEFQRADCAPIGTLGNGNIAASDVAQAKRYQIGADPLQSAGGAFSFIPPFAPESFVSDKTNNKAAFLPRAVRVITVNSSAGSLVTVSVEVDAEGDENVYGFSLNYDQTKLLNPAVTIGSGATGGNVLANSVTNPGKIGFSVDFGAGTMPAGNNRQLVKVSFNVANSAAAGITPITFGNIPAIQEISNLLAQAVPANYSNGGVNILAPTASTVQVGGRVFGNTGRFLPRTRVVLVDSNGIIRTTSTNSFGYYRFDNVRAGETYVVSVVSKQYTFASQTVSVLEEVTGLDFTPLP